MAIPKVERKSDRKTAERIAWRQQLEKQGIIYYNDDGESCIKPGVIPAETILQEARDGVHHLD